MSGAEGTGTRPSALRSEVNALRGLLISTPTNLWLDFGALGSAVSVGVTAATVVLPRLVR